MPSNVQQAMKIRANDTFTNGASGLATSYYKIEFDGAFDVVQWVVTSKIATGVTGTYKVAFAVTDEIGVDTVSKAYLPIRAGVVYNDLSANGWKDATFGGAPAKQIGLAPNSGNNSAISITTDPLPLPSVPRADGKAGGILLVKVVQTDASGQFTAQGATNAAWNAARGQVWFREWFSDRRGSVDGITTLTELPTSVLDTRGYAIMGCPIVTTNTTANQTELILFTGDSRKSASWTTFGANTQNRQAAMSLSTPTRVVSVVNAAGSGHNQVQYLQVALDMITAGLTPTIIFIPGFSQNGFSTFDLFKTRNDEFMATVRAIPRLANVKFIVDTDYYVSGYAGNPPETYRQQCIAYAKSLANGTSVFCFDSDPIMTDYSTPSTPVLKSALMNADGVHANQTGLDAMTYGDGTYPGLQALYSTVFSAGAIVPPVGTNLYKATNDFKKAVFRAAGYTGTLNDMEQAYWKARL